jgi:membrane associated rhomboid family serine protease
MKYSLGFFVFVLCTIVLCIFYASDAIFCVVSGAGNENLNGYYVAKDGYYQRTGTTMSSMPDVFTYFHEKYASSNDYVAFILFAKGYWLLSTPDKSGKLVTIYDADCGNSPDSMSSCVNQPPSTGWEQSSPASALPVPTVSSQTGNLVDSFSSSQSDSSNSNLSILWNQSVTTFILLTIFIIAYILWANRIDTSYISYSYDAVINRGEYWRIVTASLSHVDALHLLFNSMALYQMGSLESIYGSMTFAYLSFALVFITILICAAMDHVLIHRYQRVDQVHAQAIGYSCVLFAWMVAISVRLPEFCPIFIFPSFCIPTWVIPFPLAMQSWTGMSGLPINVGPFILLIFTKWIIPRSSFKGHLAGIIIGYPVAWNMLNFLTLPWTLSLLLLLWIVLRKQYVWTFASVEMSFWSLSEFVPFTSLVVFYGFVVLSLILAVLYAALLLWVSWWEQLLPRTVGIFVLVTSIWAKKIEYHAFSSSVQEDTGRYLWFTWLYLLVLWLYDVWNTIVYYEGRLYLRGCGLSTTTVRTMQVLSITVVMCTLAYLILLGRLLQETRSVQDVLQFLRLDSSSIYEDSAPVYERCCKSATVAFSGASFRAHRGGESRDGATHDDTSGGGIGLTTTTNASIADTEEGQRIGSGQGYDRLSQVSEHDRSTNSQSNPLHDGSNKDKQRNGSQSLPI